MVTITVAQLVARQACRAQVVAFRSLFGESVTFTDVKSFVEACRNHATFFNFGWAADNLLSEEAQRMCMTAEGEAARLYVETCREAHPKTCCREARETYLAIEEKAWEIFTKTRAETFARLYWEENS